MKLSLQDNSRKTISEGLHFLAYRMYGLHFLASQTHPSKQELSLSCCFVEDKHQHDPSAKVFFSMKYITKENEHIQVDYAIYLTILLIGTSTCSEQLRNREPCI